MIKNVNERAADNIRILSMAMVEKAIQVTPAGQWEELILFTSFTLNSSGLTPLTRSG
jgi:hypothetical protein